MKKVILILTFLSTTYTLAAFENIHEGELLEIKVISQNEASANNVTSKHIFNVYASRGGMACIEVGSDCLKNITVNVVDDNMLDVMIEGIGSEADELEFGELEFEGTDADEHNITYIIPTHTLHWNGSGFDMPYYTEL